jgi:hypothetical protein
MHEEGKIRERRVLLRTFQGTARVNSTHNRGEVGVGYDPKE